MRRWRILALAVAASAICTVAYLVVARMAKCEEIDDLPVLSPDGLSSATSTFKACPVGLLSTTTCSVSVALNSNSASFPSNHRISVFESTDASEVPTFTWVNGQELSMRVNDIGEVQLAKHEAGGVRIRYTVPKWIWERLDTFEGDRQRVEGESQNLYKAGKLSKDDLSASIAIENAVADENARFRQWVLANATVDDQPR